MCLSAQAAVDAAIAANPDLTACQRMAVGLAAHAPVMLLTGAAGCGKTYATQARVWDARTRACVCGAHEHMHSV